MKPALIFIGDSLIVYLVIYFLAGYIVSHIVCSTGLMSADMIDADVVRSGRRREGAYGGFLMLINRLGPLIATIVIGVTHTLTGYVEGGETQSAEAIMGIKLHFGVIPVIVGLLCFVAFHFLWKLTPEKMQGIREQLMELGL